jgi:hypothetical protein
MLIGYGSYGMIIIRSSADTPMDENNPENVFTLLSYLNREQYGTRPLVYGQYYNAPLHPDQAKRYKPGNTVYAPNLKTGEYDIVATPKDTEEPVYDPSYCTVFPRMWSSQAQHIRGYKSWANIKGDPKKKPTFGENIKFFFRYQHGILWAVKTTYRGMVMRLMETGKAALIFSMMVVLERRQICPHPCHQIKPIISFFSYPLF